MWLGKRMRAILPTSLHAIAVGTYLRPNRGWSIIKAPRNIVASFASVYCTDLLFHRYCVLNPQQSYHFFYRWNYSSWSESNFFILRIYYKDKKTYGHSARSWIATIVSLNREPWCLAAWCRSYWPCLTWTLSLGRVSIHAGPSQPWTMPFPRPK